MYVRCDKEIIKDDIVHCTSMEFCKHNNFGVCTVIYPEYRITCGTIDASKLKTRELFEK